MELKENGDFCGTINSINKALSLRELHIYYVERAEAYIQLCDYQSAILNYKRVCLMEPDNDYYYKQLKKINHVFKHSSSNINHEYKCLPYCPNKGEVSLISLKFQSSK
jgi:tetratricopeptide (TPR) repeat protein